MKEWFENKSVAIVGNSMSLFECRYGTEIDSHDVVVRLNKAAMLNERCDAGQSHGTKTDVWIFWNVIEYKQLFSKYPNVKKMHAGHQSRHNHAINMVDFIYPMNPNYENLKKKAGRHNNPTTGLIALDWITHCKPSLLSIYGFDWKKTPTFTDPERKREKFCPHDYTTEEQYVRTEVLTLPNVVLKY